MFAFKTALPVCCCAVAGALAAPASASASASAQETVTRFDAAFFAASQPLTAFDMVLRLPGFSFERGDANVRGLAGSGGNVLIDGRRPSGKQEDLEAVLKRIPARSVERIDLVRPGAPGIDLQGLAFAANVVRSNRGALQGQAEIAASASDLGLSPAGGLELSHRKGDRLLELSFSAQRAPDDEKGSGPQRRRAADGQLMRDGVFSEDQFTDSVNLSSALQTPLRGGKLRLEAAISRERTRSDLSEIETLPRARAAQIAEREQINGLELSARWEVKPVEAWSTSVDGLHRSVRTRGADIAAEDGEVTRSVLFAKAEETALNARLRRATPSVDLDAGLEGAINSLASTSGLWIDEAPQNLPGSDVHVREARAELSLGAAWRADPQWLVDAGLRWEASQLRQRGGASRDLDYLKPRLRVAWTPHEGSIARLSLERLVGQLDFEDFASSTSLGNGTVTAGNPDLLPPRTWRLTATIEHRRPNGAALTVALHNDWIDDAVDHIAIVRPEGVFDGVGNIPSARRAWMSLDASVPLDGLGVRGGLLRSELIVRRSRAVDPVTGEVRGLSKEPAVEGVVRFTQDLAGRSLRWGADLKLAEHERLYRPDETRRENVAMRLEAFAEYRPAPAWSIKVHAENLTDGPIDRVRVRYDGLRGDAPPVRLETRRLRFGPSAGVLIRRQFGS